jgi:hypothetical protein
MRLRRRGEEEKEEEEEEEKKKKKKKKKKWGEEEIAEIDVICIDNKVVFYSISPLVYAFLTQSSGAPCITWSEAIGVFLPSDCCRMSVQKLVFYVEIHTNYRQSMSTCGVDLERRMLY